MKNSTKLSILLFTLVVLAGTIITTFVYFSNLKTLDTQIKTRLENHAIQLMDKISRNLGKTKHSVVNRHRIPKYMI